MNQWQPIETAPTDGTKILVQLRRGRVYAAKYRGNLWWANIYGEFTVSVHPLGWIPIPNEEEKAK